MHLKYNINLNCLNEDIELFKIILLEKSIDPVKIANLDSAL